MHLPFPHKWYVFRPSHSSRFDYPNNIWWWVQVIKFLVILRFIIKLKILWGDIHDIRIHVLGAENFRQQVTFLESSERLPEVTDPVGCPHNLGWCGDDDWRHYPNLIAPMTVSVEGCKRNKEVVRQSRILCVYVTLVHLQTQFLCCQMFVTQSRSVTGSMEMCASLIDCDAFVHNRLVL
jgi:hypothetical protein